MSGAMTRRGRLDVRLLRKVIVDCHRHSAVQLVGLM